jgi:hypothetical protein
MAATHQGEIFYLVHSMFALIPRFPAEERARPFSDFGSFYLAETD